MTINKLLSLSIDCEDERNILCTFKKLLKKAQEYYRDKKNKDDDFTAKEVFYNLNLDEAEVEVLAFGNGNILLTLYVNVNKGSDYVNLPFKDDNDLWTSDTDLQAKFEHRFSSVLFNC